MRRQPVGPKQMRGTYHHNGVPKPRQSVKDERSRRRCGPSNSARRGRTTGGAADLNSQCAQGLQIACHPSCYQPIIAAGVLDQFTQGLLQRGDLHARNRAREELSLLIQGLKGHQPGGTVQISGQGLFDAAGGVSALLGGLSARQHHLDHPGAQGLQGGAGQAIGFLDPALRRRARPAQGSNPSKV